MSGGGGSGRGVRALAMAGCVVGIFAAPAGAATFNQVVDDPADVDGGADLRQVRFEYDEDTDRTTITVVIRDTLPDKGTTPQQTAYVWVENGADGGADLVARFQRSTPDEALVSVERLTTATPFCQPAKGEQALAGGAVPIRPAEGLLEMTFAFHGMQISDTVTWSAFASSEGEQPAFDYAPDYVGPDAAVKDPADRSCRPTPDSAGWQVFLGGGKVFPDGGLPDAFIDVLGTPHGDMHAGPAPDVAVVTPDPTNRPPTVRVRVKPSSPRPDTMTTLDASDSTDPEGKPIEGIRWDLDGDGGFYDAYGAIVRLPFGMPGRYVLAAEVTDAAGRRATRNFAVQVRGRGAGVRRLATRTSRARTRRASFERGSEGWKAFGMRFRREGRGSMSVSRVLDLEARVGGSYGDVAVDARAAGRRWATSFDPGRRAAGMPRDARGDLATGVLVSPRMKASGRYLALRLGGNGPRGARKQSPVRVEVWARRAGGGFERQDRMTRPAGRLEHMRQVVLDVGPARRRFTEWVVVAIDESPFAHINIDGVQFAHRPSPTPPPPVLGFANTHEHLMAHQAFGGIGDGARPYMGVPGRSLAAGLDPVQYARDTLRDDDAHFGGPLGRLLTNVVERRRHAPEIHTAFFSVGEIENHGTQLGPAHQQYHVTDLRRAWEGGLRLLSSLAVNNAAMEYSVGYPRDSRTGGQPCVQADRRPCDNDAQNFVTTTDDRAILEAHVAGVRQLVAANSDWMQIVYNPDQAYDAIADRKLAIVLGTEVDTLGSLGFPSARAEVDWLWGLGYRQVQLIHAIDNRLGGTAVFQDVYNTTQDFVRRPIKHANRDAIVRRVGEQGLAMERSGAAFGHLMRVEPQGCRHAGDTAVSSVPRGQCIDWTFNWRKQVLLSIDTFGFPFLRVHPAAALVEVDSYKPARTDLQGQRNALGLTPFGHEYVRALMNRGIVIDAEHASEKAFDALTATGAGGTRGPLWTGPAGLAGCSVLDRESGSCWRRAYPLLSSHTSFRGQSLTNPSQRCFGESGASADGNPSLEVAIGLRCRTTVKGFVAREFERTPAQIEYIRRSGGMVSPVVGQDPIDSVLHERAATGSGPDWRLVPGTDRIPRSVPTNNCAGSSRGWAQAHLYAVAKMRGVGVGLSGDMQMAGSAGPRYGPVACGTSSAAADRRLEEILNPLQYDRGVQLTRDRVRYGEPDAVSVGGAAMRPFVPPGQLMRDFNDLGMRSLGMFPDLIQDGRNIGIHPDDLAPLFDSAQAYIDMWSKTYRVTRCDIGVRTTVARYKRCGSTRVQRLNETSVCRNACPASADRGLRLRPNHTPYRFKAPFDEGFGVRGWGEWPF